MKSKIDTIIFAVALFCISGAAVTYNIMLADGSVDGGDIAVSLTELAEYRSENLLSEYSRDAVSAATKMDDGAIMTGGSSVDSDTNVFGFDSIMSGSDTNVSGVDSIISDSNESDSEVIMSGSDSVYELLPPIVTPPDGALPSD
ncbi:MAG TPA: hypothetical protein H9681_05485 [Firmicutes bacterium]|nr:hypothetical protein [Bacillota bacterium]